MIIMTSLSITASTSVDHNASAVDERDLQWTNDPKQWHQQTARIVDHRFTTFAELRVFANNAKRAGVSVLMLVEPQKTSACPGNWYNGLQLCDHINGSFPASDGTLAQWQALLREVQPMRFMWWMNPVYWSVQGPVFAEAKLHRESDVSKWFSWAAESCAGIPDCYGNPVVVPGVGCVQGSWASDGEGKGVQSALASFGSPQYAAYLSDAMANSWTRNLGISGYTIDCSANYNSCMLQTKDAQGDFYIKIVGKVRETQPQVVLSGESYSSWDEVIRTNSQMGGQGSNDFHVKMQQAVLSKDLDALEEISSSSGADTATMACYLHPELDGQQPGGCPTLYYREALATIPDVRQHQMWVALEAASGIVPEHDYDPTSSCSGWSGCQPGKGGEGAWWNVSNDPYDQGVASPLWAFTKFRALNRLAVRTKLSFIGGGGGALALLKHDSMGPAGDAAILLFNPGTAQNLTVDLAGVLPSAMLDGTIVPYDLLSRAVDLAAHAASATTPPLVPRWTVELEAGEIKFFGGFSLGVFAPRTGKTAGCTSDYTRLVANATSFHECFLACAEDRRCKNVLLKVFPQKVTAKLPARTKVSNELHRGLPCKDGCDKNGTSGGYTSNCKTCSSKASGLPFWSCAVCCDGCTPKHAAGGMYCVCGSPPPPSYGIPYMDKVPPLQCTVLGAVTDPSAQCTAGNGTLVRRLQGPRRCANRWHEQGGTETPQAKGVSQVSEGPPCGS